jgi:transcriptional regulator with XRE-family HTH domain
VALFFDQAWFDSRLSALGLTRSEIALALGLTSAEIEEIWKDQRELSARDVGTLAQLLAASPHEIATHAGVSTPIPSAHKSDPALIARLDRLEESLTRVERELSEIKASIAKGKK